MEVGVGVGASAEAVDSVAAVVEVAVLLVEEVVVEILVEEAVDSVVGVEAAVHLVGVVGVGTDEFNYRIVRRKSFVPSAHVINLWSMLFPLVFM